jgi:L-iditol 2-dehydrogenase
LCGELVKPGGTVVLIGIPERDIIELDTGAWRRKGLTVRFIRRSRLTTHRALDLIASGQIEVRSLISHRFTLDELDKAFQIVAKYDDKVVKTIINCSS